jgi:hypothetical protein
VFRLRSTGKSEGGQGGRGDLSANLAYQVPLNEGRLLIYHRKLLDYCETSIRAVAVRGSVLEGRKGIRRL